MTIENYNIERFYRPAYIVLNKPSNMQALIVRLKLPPSNLMIVNVYHCPSDNITDDVISDYRKLFNSCKNKIITLGDFIAYSILL